MQNHLRHYLLTDKLKIGNLPSLATYSEQELKLVYETVKGVLMSGDHINTFNGFEKSLGLIYEINKLDRIEVDPAYVIEYINFYILPRDLKIILTLLSEDHIRIHRAVKASGQRLSLQQFYTNKLFYPDLMSQFDKLLEAFYLYGLTDDLTDGTGGTEETGGTEGDSVIDYTFALLRENGTDDESEYNRNLIHIINSSLFYGVVMNFDNIDDETLRNELTGFGQTVLDTNNGDDIDFIRNNVKALIFARNIRDLFNSLENRSIISIRVNYIDISELPPMMREFRNIIQENIDSMIPSDDQVEKEMNEVITRLGL